MGRELFYYDGEMARLYGAVTICGVDEAGRGPLAGPVYAGAVILNRDIEIEGLNDSKKLSEKLREELFDKIMECAVSCAVAFSTVEEIENTNILEATMLAMNRAVTELRPPPDLCLVDGNQIKGIGFKCVPVIGGDGKSASIAAASILAKVTRDRYMIGQAEFYPQYGFEKHKGYGTKLHREMLRKHGPSSIHRMSFLKKIL